MSAHENCCLNRLSALVLILTSSIHAGGAGRQRSLNRLSALVLILTSARNKQRSLHGADSVSIAFRLWC